MTQGYENWTEQQLHERLRELLHRRSEAIVERDARVAASRSARASADPRLRTLVEGDRRRAREAGSGDSSPKPVASAGRVGRYACAPGSREMPLMSVRDPALYERWTRLSGASQHEPAGRSPEQPAQGTPGRELAPTPAPALAELGPLECEIDAIERGLEVVRQVLARRAELDRVERFARILALLRSQVPRHGRQALGFDVESFIARNAVQIRQARALALSVGRRFPDRDRDFLSLPENIRERLLNRINSL